MSVLLVLASPAGAGDDAGRLRACVLDPGNTPGACAGLLRGTCGDAAACLRHEVAVWEHLLEGYLGLAPGILDGPLHTGCGHQADLCTRDRLAREVMRHARASARLGLPDDTPDPADVEALEACILETAERAPGDHCLGLLGDACEADGDGDTLACLRREALVWRRIARDHRPPGCPEPAGDYAMLTGAGQAPCRAGPHAASRCLRDRYAGAAIGSLLAGACHTKGQAR